MPTRVLDPDPEFTLAAVPADAAAELGRHGTMPVRRSRSTALVLAALLALIVAAAAYLFWPRAAPPMSQAVPTPPPVASAPPSQSPPAIQYPIGNTPGAAMPKPVPGPASLPSLDDSDAIALAALQNVFDSATLARWLVPTAIIRHVVVTVENLPRATVAPRLLPVKPVGGAIATVAGAGGTTIAGDNVRRYDAAVKAAESIDTQRLVDAYVRLYPLFQQAYLELGHPGGYFNDRLIGVIDHLLAAPEPRAPVVVSQPKVVFEFSDPELEALSAGQKILVRVGLDNEVRLKAKLREIRKALTGRVEGNAGQAVTRPGS